MLLFKEKMNGRKWLLGCFVLGLIGIAAFQLRHVVLPKFMGNHDHVRVFDEAAVKRFPIKKSNLTAQVPPETVPDVKTTLSRELMVERLMGEALDHRPELLRMAKERVEAKNPAVVQLTQAINGENFSQVFWVSDTTNCSDQYESVNQLRYSLEDIFERFCVDRHFDYPGGFRSDGPIQLTVIPRSDIAQYEGLDNGYESLVRQQLRELIIEDFSTYYQTTGNLSYAR